MATAKTFAQWFLKQHKEYNLLTGLAEKKNS